jgi:peptidoglycan/LPS O-acetylase OafA/YrhL
MQKLLIWIFLIIGYLIAIYDTLYWLKGEPYNLLVSAFFFPSIRIIWAINTSTLIWMCITGNGGFINKFFSWKAFVPLSRLTYSVYLTHAWIVWIYWGSKRDLQDMNSFTIILLFCGVIFMSVITGAVFSLLFESPLFAFLKYIKNIFLVKDNNILITSTNMSEMQKMQI